MGASTSSVAAPPDGADGVKRSPTARESRGCITYESLGKAAYCATPLLVEHASRGAAALPELERALLCDWRLSLCVVGARQDPEMVAELDNTLTPTQREQLRGKLADRRLMRAAGVPEERSHERRLAATMDELLVEQPDVMVASQGFVPLERQRVALARFCDDLLRAERTDGNRPYLLRRRNVPEERDASKTIVLLALSSLVSASALSTQETAPMLLEMLKQGVAKLRPLSLFPEWSPRQAGAEAPLLVSASMAFASSSLDEERTGPGRALAEGSTSGWSSRAHGSIGSAADRVEHWGVKLAREEAVSSVRVRLDPSMWPQEIALQLSTDGSSYVTVSEVPVADTVVQLPGHHGRATHVRLQLTGVGATNTSGRVGFIQVSIATPKEDELSMDVLNVAADIQRWLLSVDLDADTARSVRSDALACGFSLAAASGSLAAVLRLIICLLCQGPDAAVALPAADRDDGGAARAAGGSGGGSDAETRNPAEAFVSLLQRKIEELGASKHLATEIPARFDISSTNSPEEEVLQLSLGGRAVRVGGPGTARRFRLVALSHPVESGTKYYCATFRKIVAGPMSLMGFVRLPLSGSVERLEHEPSGVFWRLRDGSTYKRGARLPAAGRFAAVRRHDVVSMVMDRNKKQVVFKVTTPSGSERVFTVPDALDADLYTPVLLFDCSIPEVAAELASASKGDAAPQDSASSSEDGDVASMVEPLPDEERREFLEGRHGAAQLAMLESMGFHFVSCGRALAHSSGDVEGAADWLLANSASEQRALEAMVARHEARETRIRELEREREAKAMAAAAERKAREAETMRDYVIPVPDYDTAHNRNLVMHILVRLEQLAGHLAVPPAAAVVAPDLEAPLAIQPDAEMFSLLHALLVTVVDAAMPAGRPSLGEAATEGGASLLGSGSSGAESPQTGPCAPVERRALERVRALVSENALHAPEGEYLNLIILLVRLLKHNLRRVISAHVDPAEIFSDSQRSSPLQGAAATLRALVCGDFPQIVQMEAALALEAGLPLLLPEPMQRTQLLAELLRSDGDERGQQATKHLILSVLARFTTPGGILALLPCEGAAAVPASDVAARSKASDDEGDEAATHVAHVLGKLVSSSERTTTLQLQNASTSVHPVPVHDTGDSSINAAVDSVLAMYQRHLISVAAETRSATSPAAAALVTYVRMLLDCVNRILDVAQAVVAEQREGTTESTVTAFVVERVLGSSVVGQLLPALLVGVMALPERSCVSEQLLSPLTAVLSRLHRCNHCLPAVRARTAELERERRQMHRTIGQRRDFNLQRCRDGYRRLREVQHGSDVNCGYEEGRFERGRLEGVGRSCSPGGLTVGLRNAGVADGLAVRLSHTDGPGCKVDLIHASSAAPDAADAAALVRLEHQARLLGGWAATLQLHSSGRLLHLVMQLTEFDSGKWTGVGKFVSLEDSVLLRAEAPRRDAKLVSPEEAEFRVRITAHPVTGEFAEVCIEPSDGATPDPIIGVAELRCELDVEARSSASVLGPHRGPVARGHFHDPVSLHLWRTSHTGPTGSLFNSHHWMIDLLRSVTSLASTLAADLVRATYPAASDRDAAALAASELFSGGLDHESEIERFPFADVGADSASAPAVPRPQARKRQFAEDIVASTRAEDGPVGVAAATLELLDSLAPEPAMMRKRAREKRCEALFAGAMLWHSGLWAEATQLLTDARPDASLPPYLASPRLVSLAQRVRRLRRWLRDRKQLSAAHLFRQTSVRASPPPQQEEAEEKKADGVEREEKDDDDSAVRSSPTPEAGSQSYEDLVTDVVRRCQFLLELGSALDASLTGEHPKGTPDKPPGESDSGLPAASPPLLHRWSSGDGSLSSEKWGGVAGMLRRHMSLRRQVSVDSVESEDAFSGATDPLDELDQEEGVDDDDLPTASPDRRVAAACLSYVQRALDGSCSPRSLRSLMAKRCRFARLRAVGLTAFRWILSACDSPFIQRDVISRVRPALSFKASHSDTLAAATDRHGHHYLAGVEGCSRELADLLQLTFNALYTDIATVGEHATQRLDLSLAATCYAAWAVEFRDDDHEFLLRMGRLPALHDAFGLKAASTRAKLQVELAHAAALRGYHEIPEWVLPGWLPDWHNVVHNVPAQLAAGSLRIRDVVLAAGAVANFVADRSTQSSGLPDPTLGVYDSADPHYTAREVKNFVVAAHALQKTPEELVKTHTVLSASAAWLAVFVNGKQCSVPANRLTHTPSRGADAGRSESKIDDESASDDADRVHVGDVLQPVAWALFRWFGTVLSAVTAAAGALPASEQFLAPLTLVSPSRKGPSERDHELVEAAEGKARYSLRLRSMCFEILESELAACVDAFDEAGVTVSSRPQTEGLEMLELEQHAERLLLSVSSLPSTAETAAHVASPSFLRSLRMLAGVVHTEQKVLRCSFRLRRVALRVLRAVLPSLLPSMFASAAASPASPTRSHDMAGESVHTDFPHHVLVVVGHILARSADARPDVSFAKDFVKFDASLGLAGSHTALSFAAELVSLLRTMLKARNWRKTIRSVLKAALLPITSARKTLTDRQVCETVGTLATLGGLPEIIRVGAQVFVEQSSTTAAVVEILDDVEVLTVAHGGGTMSAAIQDAFFGEVQPLEDVDVAASSFPLSEALADAYGSCIRSLRPKLSTACEPIEGFVRALALRSLSMLLDHEATARAALMKSLLLPLFDVALQPVDHFAFRQPAFIERHRDVLHHWLVALTSGVDVCLRDSSMTRGSASPAVRKLRDDEEALWRAAVDVAAKTGLAPSVCENILAMTGYVPQMAVDWASTPSNLAKFVCTSAGAGADTLDAIGAGDAQHLGVIPTGAGTREGDRDKLVRNLKVLDDGGFQLEHAGKRGFVVLARSETDLCSLPPGRVAWQVRVTYGVSSRKSIRLGVCDDAHGFHSLGQRDNGISLRGDGRVFGKGATRHDGETAAVPDGSTVLLEFDSERQMLYYSVDGSAQREAGVTEGFTSVRPAFSLSQPGDKIEWGWCLLDRGAAAAAADAPTEALPAKLCLENGPAGKWADPTAVLETGDDGWVAVQANRGFRTKLDGEIPYFEATVVNNDGLMVGWTSAGFPLRPGHGNVADCVFYSSDGRVHMGAVDDLWRCPPKEGRATSVRCFFAGPPLAVGDVVGCGISTAARRFFVTINGKLVVSEGFSGEPSLVTVAVSRGAVKDVNVGPRYAFDTRVLVRSQVVVRSAPTRQLKDEAVLEGLTEDSTPLCKSGDWAYTAAPHGGGSGPGGPDSRVSPVLELGESTEEEDTAAAAAPRRRSREPAVRPMEFEATVVPLLTQATNLSTSDEIVTPLPWVIGADPEDFFISGLPAKQAMSAAASDRFYQTAYTVDEGVAGSHEFAVDMTEGHDYLYVRAVIVTPPSAGPQGGDLDKALTITVGAPDSAYRQEIGPEFTNICVAWQDSLKFRVEYREDFPLTTFAVRWEGYLYGSHSLPARRGNLVCVETVGAEGAFLKASDGSFSIKELACVQLGTLHADATVSTHAPVLVGSSESRESKLVLYPWNKLYRIVRVLGLPVDEEETDDPLKLLRSASSTLCRAVSVRYSREAVLSILKNWPRDIPVSVDAVGGPDRLLKLAKLVAATDDPALRSSTDSDSRHNGAAGDRDAAGGGTRSTLIQDRLKVLLQAEAGLDVPDRPAALHGPATPDSRASSAAAGGKLASMLVKDCVNHFASVLSPATGSETGAQVERESLHPCPPLLLGIRKVCIEGAQALHVSFKPQCHLTGASLYFYLSTDALEPVAVYSGKPSRRSGDGSSTLLQPWQSFTVLSDTLWYALVPSDEMPHGEAIAHGDTVGWGFSFVVRPHVENGWVTERAALTQPSLEWACWLLSFLLDDDMRDIVPIGSVHNRAVYDALVRYLRTPSEAVRGARSLKRRIVAMLIQLLQLPHHFSPASRPTFEDIARWAPTIMSRCLKKLKKGDLFMSSRLLQLVELIVTARAAKLALNRTDDLRGAATSEGGAETEPEDASGTSSGVDSVHAIASVVMGTTTSGFAHLPPDVISFDEAIELFRASYPRCAVLRHKLAIEKCWKRVCKVVQSIKPVRATAGYVALDPAWLRPSAYAATGSADGAKAFQRWVPHAGRLLVALDFEGKGWVDVYDIVWLCVMEESSAAREFGEAQAASALTSRIDALSSASKLIDRSAIEACLVRRPWLPDSAAAETSNVTVHVERRGEPSTPLSMSATPAVRGSGEGTHRVRFSAAENATTLCRLHAARSSRCSPTVLSMSVVGSGDVAPGAAAATGGAGGAAETKDGGAAEDASGAAAHPHDIDTTLAFVAGRRLTEDRFDTGKALRQRDHWGVDTLDRGTYALLADVGTRPGPVELTRRFCAVWTGGRLRESPGLGLNISICFRLSSTGSGAEALHVLLRQAGKQVGSSGILVAVSHANRRTSLSIQPVSAEIPSCECTAQRGDLRGQTMRLNIFDDGAAMICAHLWAVPKYHSASPQAFCVDTPVASVTTTDCTEGGTREMKFAICGSKNTTAHLLYVSVDEPLAERALGHVTPVSDRCIVTGTAEDTAGTVFDVSGAYVDGDLWFTGAAVSPPPATGAAAPSRSTGDGLKQRIMWSTRDSKRTADHGLHAAADVRRAVGPARVFAAAAAGDGDVDGMPYQAGVAFIAGFDERAVARSCRLGAQCAVVWNSDEGGRGQPPEEWVDRMRRVPMPVLVVAPAEGKRILAALADSAAAVGSTPAAAPTGDGEARAEDATPREASEGKGVEDVAEGRPVPPPPVPSPSMDIALELPEPLGGKLTDGPPNNPAIVATLVDVFELVGAMQARARLPARFLCQAWRDSSQASRYVESAHPATGPQEGSLEVAGATVLEVTLDPRCDFGASGVLAVGGYSITAGDVAAKRTKRIKLHAGLVTWKWSGCAEGGRWGFGFSVTASEFAPSTTPISRLRADPAAQAGLRAASTAMSRWTPQMDSQLVDWVNQHCKADSGVASKMPLRTRLPDVSEVYLTERDAYRYQLLAEVPTQELRLRFCLLQCLNERVEHVVHLVNLVGRGRAGESKWSIGARLRALGHCLFMTVKTPVLKEALRLTEGSSSGTKQMTLDNALAIESESKGEFDPSSSRCIFVQAYRAAQKWDAKVFRGVSSEDRVFKVQFSNEAGIDAGGVYREGLTRIMDDLFSSRFTLLLPCPNMQAQRGQNMGSYVPSPAQFSAESLKMFSFVGVLMGVSLRRQASLPFAFPSVVWKRLLGVDVDRDDLRAMDEIAVEFLDAIEHCEKDGITSEAAFAEAYDELFFTITATDGADVELIPGGDSVPVTFSTRHRYVRLAEQFRLHEFDRQIHAMQHGMRAVVPLRALRLFTWQEVETQVTGHARVDVDVLKRNTEYKGFAGPSDPTIRLFWRIFESLSDDDRAQYIRFAWGRSRLPVASARWTNQHTLKRRVDTTRLPVSHTCFFSVELPAYATEEQMRWGLLKAIHYGAAGILNG